MNKLVAVFDSGIGGLTVARELARAFPKENLVYLGDTARLPYGSKSNETIRAYAARCVAFLARFPIKALVVACNTVSATSLPMIKAMVNVPVLGVIEPGAAAATQVSARGRIAVIGQPGTIRSGAYEAAIRRLRPEAQVVSFPTPLLVPMAEEGWMGTDVARMVLDQYLKRLWTSEMDTLVLGCTHYPLFKKDISLLAAEKQVSLALVDSATALAEEMRRLMLAGVIPPEEAGTGSLRCFVTDSPESFATVGAAFWGSGFGSIEQVDL